MNIENRATKIYLKSLPPLTVKKLVNQYEIPSPYKEILITICAEHISGFKALDHLEEKYNIRIEYWTLVRYFKIGLEMFRKSHSHFYVDI